MTIQRTLAAQIVVLLCCALPASSQTGAGVIQGVVKDVTNAVIVGAEVTAAHGATGRTSSAKTNEAGLYLFPSSPIGEYSITVVSPGMKTWRGQIVLQVGQTAVVDVVLAVGDTVAEVTVAGDVTPLLTLNNATLGNVLERTRVEQLPLNGRFLQNLVMTTTPGLEGGGGDPRVYGLAIGAAQYLQDGAALGNRDQGGLAASSRPPGIDTVQEFRVETNNSSAKISRPASIIISTKSGTNQVHGSVFETHRNNAIGLARQRQDTYEKAPQLIRNEFGASLGGPVYLPKIYNGRNRTFFFFSYEGFRQVTGSTVTTTLPTMAMRQGDFSGLVDAAGRRYTLYDPMTTDASWLRQPFPNNQIPAGRQSPTSKYLFGITPAPTLAEVNPLIAANYFAPGGARQLEHTETARIDHQLSSRDQVFGRYTFGKPWRRTLNYASNPPTSTGETGYQYIFAPVHSGVFSWTRTFSPTLFSETIFSSMREDWKINATGDSGSSLLEKIGIPLPAPRPLAGQQQREIGFGMNFFYWSQEGRHNITQSYSVEQNFTKIRGRHELQFGGRMRNVAVDVVPDEPVVGVYYDSAATALYDPRSGSSYGATPNTGNNTANFFLGIARYYNASLERTPYYLTEREYALYLQDNIRVNQRLTLNFGLRYENYPALKERNNLLTSFDFKSKSVVVGRSPDQLYAINATTPEVVGDYQRLGVKFATPEQVGMPRGVLNGDPWAFGPRAGFAWRVGPDSRSTVVRGGYAVFRHSTYDRTFTRHMRTAPPLGYTRTINFNAAAQSPDGLPNYLLRSAPPVIAGVNSAGVLNSAAARQSTPGSFSVICFAPDQPSAQAHEWNLTIEREVIPNTVLRVGYVGTHGSNLSQYTNRNDPPNSYVWFVTTGLPLPTGQYAATAMRPYDQTVYANINQYGKTGWSNATSLRAEVERRYSKGVGFQLFYVMTNAFRAGGGSEDEDALLMPTQFLPGAVPTDPGELNRFLNYKRDTGIPKHRLRWNWIADLPFGKGKRFGGNSNRLLDAVIGGWQLAGSGNMNSRWWALPADNWGPQGNVEIYGTKYPIEDCRSGRCIPGYLYYNGYIPANRINSYDAKGNPNGVMGVPSNYQPSSRPIITTPANGGSASDPNFPYYETNTVWVPLKNGSQQRIAMNTNLHPWRNQFKLGPKIWSLDASLFKRVALTERLAVRLNADFFNVLNMPGMPMPGAGTGIINTSLSAQGARVLQLTLRLSW